MEQTVRGYRISGLFSFWIIPTIYEPKIVQVSRFLLNKNLDTLSNLQSILVADRAIKTVSLSGLQ